MHVNEVRQRFVADMAFNLGLCGSPGSAWHSPGIAAGDYHWAAEEPLASRWAEQVKGQALLLAEMMRTGMTSET
jgi:lysozyme